MNTKLLPGLALALRAGMFGLVLASSSCQSLHNGAVVNTSSEKNGVTVELSLPDTVSAGQPVEMLVNVTNAGPKSVFFMTWISALGIHLVDSNKATPEMTPRGTSGPDAVKDYGIYYAIPSIRELKPGEHHEWRVDLGTLFILKPGKYQVSLKLKLNQRVPGGTAPFYISTDPLQFNVETNRATSKNRELILLVKKPENAPTVEIRGPGFAKQGYVVWHSGLSLGDIESGIGYNREYPLPIFVSIHRKGRRIFEAIAIETPGEAARTSGINSGKIREKPDAPPLAPGDTVLADRPYD